MLRWRGRTIVGRALTLVVAASLWVAGTLPSAASVVGLTDEFVVLVLEGGDLTINSSRSLVGNVGYSRNVTSATNQKVDSFVGSALVHSTATFDHTPATFDPTGGILTGSSVDDRLDRANADARRLSRDLGALTPTHDLGALGDGDSTRVVSVGDRNVIRLTSLSFKEDFLELVGDANDMFIFNVLDNFKFAASEIVLSGVRPENVVFNFPSPSEVMIDLLKAETVFMGTILAPSGVVDYHNPATFKGTMIASSINLHSDFNMESITPIPLPGALPLLVSGLGLLLGFTGWRRLSS